MDPQSTVVHAHVTCNYASLAGLAALYAAGSAFNRLNAMIAHSLASPGNAESDQYLAGPAIAFACHALSTDAAFINFDVGGDNNLMTSLEVAATICAASIVSTLILLRARNRSHYVGGSDNALRESRNRHVMGLLRARNRFRIGFVTTWHVMGT